MEQTITKHHHPKALEIKERQTEPQLMQERKSLDFVMNVETRLPCLTSDFAVSVA